MVSLVNLNILNFYYQFVMVHSLMVNNKCYMTKGKIPKIANNQHFFSNFFSQNETIQSKSLPKQKQFKIRSNGGNS